MDRAEAAGEKEEERPWHWVRLHSLFLPRHLCLTPGMPLSRRDSLNHKQFNRSQLQGTNQHKNQMPPTWATLPLKMM